MNEQTTGTNGKKCEALGTVVPVRIIDDQWDSISEIIRLEKNEIDKRDGLVSQQTVMCELGIDKKTLANYISSGRITSDMYVVSPVNGRKQFRLNKILGIEK